MPDGVVLLLSAAVHATLRAHATYAAHYDSGQRLYGCLQTARTAVHSLLRDSVTAVLLGWIVQDSATTLSEEVRNSGTSEKEGGGKRREKKERGSEVQV